jgi:hypothetical protein
MTSKKSRKNHINRYGYAEHEYNVYLDEVSRMISGNKYCVYKKPFDGKTQYALK